MSKRKKTQQKTKKIKICPRCGSTKIKIPPAGLDIKMTFPDYCEDCGTIGIFPLIEKDKLEKINKMKKEKIKQKK